MNAAWRYPDRPKILYVENLDRYFLTHRIAVVKKIEEAGFDVIAAAGESDKGEQIRQAGIPFVALPLKREGMNPVGEVQLMAAFFKLYRRLQPTIIHHFNVKPVTYGSLVARASVNSAILNTVTGLGQAFAEEKQRSLQNRVVTNLYWMALRHPCSWTTFQNPDDRQAFIDMNLVSSAKSSVILGSGVDPEKFAPQHEPETPPIIAFSARLMWAKGVGDFVEMSRRLKDKSARFVLIGDPDPDNQDSVPEDQIKAWVEEGIIEWWGYQKDMPKVLSQVAVVVLPSVYPEGIPKILIESASMARALITYDMPGCREIVRDQVNGFVVPPKDIDALTKAVETLIDNPTQCKAYGEASRQHVIASFSLDHVTQSFLQIYRQLMEGKPHG
jgi:glycosyltransferase involved in cell wall biosynthesis